MVPGRRAFLECCRVEHRRHVRQYGRLYRHRVRGYRRAADGSEKAAEAAKEEKAAKGAAGSASSDEKGSHELDPAADDDEGKPSEREESGREADERELPEKDAASSAVEAEPDASAAAGARSNGTSAKSKPTVTVAEAQKSYEDKKATVFSLDTTDLGSTAKASSSEGRSSLRRVQRDRPHHGRAPSRSRWRTSSSTRWTSSWP